MGRVLHLRRRFQWRAIVKLVRLKKAYLEWSIMFNVLLEVKDSLPNWKLLLLNSLKISKLHRVMKVRVLEIASEKPCLECDYWSDRTLLNQLSSSTSEEHLR